MMDILIGIVLVLLACKLLIELFGFFVGIKIVKKITEQRHAAHSPKNMGGVARVYRGDEMIKKVWPLLRPVTLRDCGHTHAKSCSHEP